MSSFRFFCAASPSSSSGQTSLVKVKCFPVFDQMWLSASVEMLVICFASPPAIGINQICCEPAREERNAMLWLSYAVLHLPLRLAASLPEQWTTSVFLLLLVAKFSLLPAMYFALGVQSGRASGSAGANPQRGAG
jgi:hypothetical protein